jgi:ABC-2 type transport system ATP-binding protein
MLKIEGVTKTFGSFTAVNKVTVHVEPGAGKTTTFRMILGLLDPNEGHITWNGESISYKNTNLFGYLPEERGLYPKMKVREQLIYLGRLKGMKKRDILREIDYWFTRFNILPYVGKKAGELSKGNQQKIQFIVAVLHKPKLLILDEPFSGLDPVNVELLKSAISDLKKDGVAIIFSSHRMDHIEEICEDICMLKKGTPVAQGKIPAIKAEHPTHAIIAKFNDESIAKKAAEGLNQNIEWIKPTIIRIFAGKDDERSVFAKLATFDVIAIEKEERSLNEIFILRVGESHD